VPARAAVYVGDQLEVDALAATAAGLRGIWLNRNGGAVPSGVEAIDSPDRPAEPFRRSTDLKARAKLFAWQQPIRLWTRAKAASTWQ